MILHEIRIPELIKLNLIADVTLRNVSLPLPASFLYLMNENKNETYHKWLTTLNPYKFSFIKSMIELVEKKLR